MVILAAVAARRSESTSDETWIGVIEVLEGDGSALAWVRRRDEWLADAEMAPRGDEIARLAAMYETAVEKRGYTPAKLVVRAAADADALRAQLGADVVIEVGFDARAQALSDEAASAVEIIFGAAATVREADGGPGDGTSEHLVATEYDPEQTPAPGPWLAMSKPERQRHVRMAHLALTDSLRGHELQLHAAMHEAVETQLAEDDPAQVGTTLARLQRAGVRRHEAVHAIARVLMRRMQVVLTTEQPFDNDAYIAELRELAPSPG